MDGVALLRMFGGLATVLGLLAGALWIVRRYGLTLPGAAMRPERRLALVERLALDPRRALLLVRRDGREHLILVGPDGALLVEGGVEASAPTTATASTPLVSFAAVLAGDQARTGRSQNA